MEATAVKQRKAQQSAAKGTAAERRRMLNLKLDRKYSPPSPSLSTFSLDTCTAAVRLQGSLTFFHQLTTLCSHHHSTLQCRWPCACLNHCRTI